MTRLLFRRIARVALLSGVALGPLAPTAGATDATADALRAARQSVWSGCSDEVDFPLSVGSSGPCVQHVQEALQLLGFSVGASGPDGLFGPDTQAAVQAWQASIGRPVTGVVTGEEYSLLGSSATADAGGSDAPAPVTAGDTLPLHVGSSGPRVEQLQQVLLDLGFSVGSSGADGQFGPDTQAAVQAWQASVGYPADGQVTEAQFNELVAATAVPAGAPPVASAAPIAGEAHVLFSATEGNTSFALYDVVGGIATPVPGIDPMSGAGAGAPAWSTDLTTLYLAGDELRAIDLAALESTTVACGECRGIAVMADGTVVTLESDGSALGFTPSLEPAFTRSIPPFFDNLTGGTSWVAGSVDDDLIVAATDDEGGTIAVARIRSDGLAVWTFESPADVGVFGGFAIAPSGSRAAFVRPVPGESDETTCDEGGEVVILDLQTGAINPAPLTVPTIGGDTRLSSPTGLIWAGETLYTSHPVTIAGFESDIRLGCSDYAPHALWAWENAWTNIDVGYDNVAMGVPTSASTMVLSEYYGGRSGVRQLVFQRAGEPISPLSIFGHVAAVSPIAVDHRDVMTTDLATATPPTPAVPAVPATTPVAPTDGLGVLSGSGIAGAQLGEDGEAVVAELTAMFGAPTADLGWEPIEGDMIRICAVDRWRYVSWGNLRLLFGYWDFDTNTPTEDPRFLHYSYFQYEIELTPAAFQNFTTDRGLALGDPLARLVELYPDVEYYFDDLNNSGGAFSTSEGLRGGLDIGDRAEPGNPEDFVNGIVAGGFPCGE